MLVSICLGLIQKNGGEIKMKRMWILGLAAVLSLSLVACGGGAPSSTGGSNEPKQSQEKQEDSNKEQEDSEKASESDQMANVGDDIEIDEGNYSVKIDSFSMAKDLDGKPAVIISYTFTNNSQDTISAVSATLFKVFQDGVELDHAFVTEGMEGSNAMKDLRPGNSIDNCRVAYVLTSKNEIEIEVASITDMVLGKKVLVKAELPEQ